MLNTFKSPAQFSRSLFRLIYGAILVLLGLVGSPLLGQFGSSVQHFPQVVLNAGSTTSFTIHNPSEGETITVGVKIYSAQGEDLANGQVELMPGATETIVFGDEQAPLTRGWAQLTSDEPFIATEFFQILLSELTPRIGVLPSPPSTGIRFLGFVNSEFISGLAVHNPSADTATEVTVRVKDMAGQEAAAEKSLMLAPLESAALFLNGPELFGAGLANFLGAVEMSSSIVPVSVLSLTQASSGDIATVAVEAQSFVRAGPMNTALGQGALISNTEGTNNAAVGVNALRFNTIGTQNTGVGDRALAQNTEGTRNTAIGSQSLLVNTVGQFNTASGVLALGRNLNGSANTASGDLALFANTGGGANTAVGTQALQSNTVGFNNAAFGSLGLATNVSGSRNTAIGVRADVATEDLTNATAIGADTIVDASNKIRLGNENVTVIEGEVAFTFTSDKHKKENFLPVDGEQVLDKLRSLEIPSWNYVGQDPEKFRHYGPMAQDFYQAFGEDEIGAVGTPTTLNTGDLTGILMIAVQALERRSAENARLKERLAELERTVQQIQSEASRAGRVRDDRR